jgi:hypothetical protein
MIQDAGGTRHSAQGRVTVVSDSANPGLWCSPRIAIVVACLTVSRMAYLAGAFDRSSGLFQKQADKEPSQRRDNHVAGEPHQQYPWKRWLQPCVVQDLEHVLSFPVLADPAQFAQTLERPVQRQLVCRYFWRVLLGDG